MIISLLIVSCKQQNELFEDQLDPQQSVSLMDDAGGISLLYPNDIDPSASDRDSVPFLEKGHESIQLRSSSGVITVVGYTGRTKINSEMIGFGGYNKYGLSGYYVCDVYKYYYQITVPHGASVTIPELHQMTDPNMGWIGPMNFTKGYSKETVSLNSNGDTFYLYTYLRIITHNSVGQQVGPYYYPFDITTPSNFVFKYTYTTLEWNGLLPKRNMTFFI